jgi:predicted ester cyclase
MNNETIFMSEKLTPELKKIIETFYLSFNNPDLLPETLAEGFVDHMPFNPESKPGIDGFKNTVKSYLQIFSDFHFDFKGIYVDGDKVTVRSITTAKHTGEFMGIKPTGKEVSWVSIDIYTVKDNKLAEGWHVESFLKTYINMLNN